MIITSAALLCIFSFVSQTSYLGPIFAIELVGSVVAECLASTAQRVRYNEGNGRTIPRAGRNINQYKIQGGSVLLPNQPAWCFKSHPQQKPQHRVSILPPFFNDRPIAVSSFKLNLRLFLSHKISPLPVANWTQLHRTRGSRDAPPCHTPHIHGRRS